MLPHEKDVCSDVLVSSRIASVAGKKYRILEFSTIAFLLFVQVKRRFQKFSTEYSTYVEKYLE